MQAGRLRHVVEIQDFTTAQNSSGEDIRDYFAFATTHAEIKTLRGRELFTAQQDFAEADVEISLRYLPGMDARMRVFHQGVYYDILNVNDVMRRHIDFILTCKTGLSEDK